MINVNKSSVLWSIGKNIFHMMPYGFKELVNEKYDAEDAMFYFMAIGIMNVAYVYNVISDGNENQTVLSARN